VADDRPAIRRIPRPPIDRPVLTASSSGLLVRRPQRPHANSPRRPSTRRHPRHPTRRPDPVPADNPAHLRRHFASETWRHCSVEARVSLRPRRRSRDAERISSLGTSDSARRRTGWPETLGPSLASWADAHGQLADGCVRSPRLPVVGRSLGSGVAQRPIGQVPAWRPMVSCAEVAHRSAVTEMASLGQRSLRRARRSVVTETAPSVRCHGRGRVGLRRGSRAGYLGRAAPLRSHIDGGATVPRLTPRREIVAGPLCVAGPRVAAVLQVHASRPGSDATPHAAAKPRNAVSVRGGQSGGDECEPRRRCRC
jgi:hypothetical protein